jgi:hypothetical protein
MKKRSRQSAPSAKRSRRGQRRIATLKDRAFYLRREVCAIFGFSDKRLAELVTADENLPVIKNGRYQIFPKTAFDAWYQEAGNKRLTVQGLVALAGRTTAPR